MTYTTQSGDQFDFIAFKTLGDEKFTQALINANRQFVSVLTFRAGVELTVPVITEQTQIKELPPWRK